MAETELKPCPFCGAKVGYYQGYMFAGVHCPKCGALVSFIGKEATEKVGKAWNRRAEKDVGYRST